MTMTAILDPVVVNNGLRQVQDRLQAIQSAALRGNGSEVLHHADQALQIFGAPPCLNYNIPPPPTAPTGYLLVPILSKWTDVERLLILAVLQHQQGNKTAASMVLGVSRRYVYDFLQKE